jgi:[acyl-carrier-protein] S-malonyltransferase
MGLPWVDHESFDIVHEASEVAERDIAHLVLDASSEELERTDAAQLATLVMSLVVLDAVERINITPNACAGHSLGEYSALVASGALGFEDGIRLVGQRASAMQEAAEDNPGTMAALLGISDQDAELACIRAEEDVWVANFNSPGQVVISGTTQGVEAAISEAKALGARRSVRLPVGGAFHTSLMAPARARLRKALAEVTFRDPDVTVLANVDARPHTSAEDWASLLLAQLCNPVRWSGIVNRMVTDQIHTFAELGPGGVLSGLVRRCAPQAVAVSVSTPAELDRLVEVVAGREAIDQHSQSFQGERFYALERLIVSPGAGLFVPDPAFTAAVDRQGVDAVELKVGQLIGVVGRNEVRSSFAGQLMGLLAVSGERVAEGQPLAWLREGPVK